MPTRAASSSAGRRPIPKTPKRNSRWRQGVRHAKRGAQGPPSSMSSRLVESPGRGKLVIAEPTALAVLDSDKIVVRPAPGQTAQFSDAQWEDRLPKLVQ